LSSGDKHFLAILTIREDKLLFIVDVSVIIVNWNTKDLLRDCLKSLYDRTKTTNIEVIVVDNASSDGSADMVEIEFPDVKIIRGENVGFAKANNVALSGALGKDILFLNPDTRLDTSAIDGMHSHLSKHRESVSAVGCKLLNADGSVQLTCARRFPSAWTELCYFLGLERLFGFSPWMSGSEMRHWDHNDSRFVPCLSGACIMADGDLVRKLGGFSEDYFMYGEDLELCWKLTRENRKLWYVAEERIYHFAGSSSAKRGVSFHATLRQRAANSAFLRKSSSLRGVIEYRVAVALGASFRLVLLLVLLPLSLIRLGGRLQSLRKLMLKYLFLVFWSTNLRNLDPDKDRN
jgi:hypothetical protein